jgi:heme/copper-type cytochrome/quinol oxidase subunit 2
MTIGNASGSPIPRWLQTGMQANDINVMIFWVCVAIGAAVYAAIIWSLLAYRKSKKQEASFHKSTATEIAWTVVPLILIIAMMIPAAKLLTRMYSTDVGAIGEQPTSVLIAKDPVKQAGTYKD